MEPTVPHFDQLWNMLLVGTSWLAGEALALLLLLFVVGAFAQRDRLDLLMNAVGLSSFTAGALIMFWGLPHNILVVLVGAAMTCLGIYGCMQAGDYHRQQRARRSTT